MDDEDSEFQLKLNQLIQNGWVIELPPGPGETEPSYQLTADGIAAADQIDALMKHEGKEQ